MTLKLLSRLRKSARRTKRESLWQLTRRFERSIKVSFPPGLMPLEEINSSRLELHAFLTSSFTLSVREVSTSAFSAAWASWAPTWK